MMHLGLELVLLSFALIGYIGTGASLAVARYRLLDAGELDYGMLGVGGMLLVFGAVCTSVAVGWLGVAAIGSVAIGISYVTMARQIGLFSVEVQPLSERTPDEVARR